MPGSIIEQKTGVIETIYDQDSGQLRENGSGVLYDYFEQGANVEIVRGDAVTFIKVTTPSGKVIIKGIQKGNA